jgi:hypothetical protein
VNLTLSFASAAVDSDLMATAAATALDLHSFRLAHPVIRPSRRVDATALAFLSVIAMAIWLVVLPAEFVLGLTV